MYICKDLFKNAVVYIYINNIYTHTIQYAYLNAHACTHTCTYSDTNLQMESMLYFTNGIQISDHDEVNPLSCDVLIYIYIYIHI